MDTILEWLKNQNIAYSGKRLTAQALMHSSYVNEHKFHTYDDERLEFMGDAVLQLWMTKRLFPLGLKLSEGQMITLCAQLACEEALAEYSRQLGLGRYLMLGVGKEKTGRRRQDSILADMSETLFGTVFLDRGMEVTDSVLSTATTPAISRPKSEKVTDYRTGLQEYIQLDPRKAVYYGTASVPGPSSKPKFGVIVMSDNIDLGRGKGPSKKQTEQMAAKNAFEEMIKQQKGAATDSLFALQRT